MANKQSVILNIYELPDINEYIPSSFGLGVYHTGVEVLNSEYSFGGHPHDFSGIFVMPPKNIKSLSFNAFKFKESKLIGYTEQSAEQISQTVANMGSTDFKGNKYNLLHKNCNHFSDAFCKRLCGKSIPEWVNKLVFICSKFPFIEKKIPKEFLTPVALEESVKEEMARQQNQKNQQNKQQNKNQNNKNTNG